MVSGNYIVPVMSELAIKGEKPEYLFWVGCAGAFDDRFKKVSRTFALILNHANVNYAVLGKEETCNGDPARRAGNEMLFHMQAHKVINTLAKYEVKKIVTCCPHCYNIFKNEYPDLGGYYEVFHHSQFLRNLIKEGKLKIQPGINTDVEVTFHDPCYLGRGNNEYEAPRTVVKKFFKGIKEMPRNRSFALCCGAGGAQMFKEAEKGSKEVFAERTEEALRTGAKIIATACPFCMTMLTDGIKFSNKMDEVRNLDIAEMVAESLGLI